MRAVSGLASRVWCLEFLQRKTLDTKPKTPLHSEGHGSDARQAANQRASIAGRINSYHLTVRRRHKNSAAMSRRTDVHYAAAHFFRQQLPMGAVFRFEDRRIGAACAGPSARPVLGNSQVNVSGIVLCERVAVSTIPAGRDFLPVRTAIGAS